jgi:osmotically-inducible protein OsmY
VPKPAAPSKFIRGGTNMKTQRSVLRASLTFLAIASGGTSVAVAQEVPRTAEKAPRKADVPPRAELQVLSALRTHPLTAPYPIAASWSKGAVVLSGRVGTKQVHDVAVQLAIASGSPIRDDLVIDTGLAHVAAMSAAAAGSLGMSGFARVGTSSPYIYPPPLMGRLDDPFFGFVPPLVSFPPWWRQQMQGPPMQQRPGPVAAANAAPGTMAQGDGQGPGAANGPAPAGGWQPFDVAPVKGQVEVTVDSSGQVFMRGVVTSQEAGREIEEAARAVPGVSRVFTDFQVLARRGGDQNPPPREGDPIEPRRAPPGDPPPPPEPAVLPEVPEREPAAPAPGRAKPAATGPAAMDRENLTRRVVSAISRRPVAADLPVSVRSGDGTVTLTGRVPSAFEAMVVYRAAQQTPGVREVIDRLEFTVPDEDHPNPLLEKARPEDLEPFLESQIRRHVGDLAHIDRIQAQGNVIDIRGTLGEGQDRERLLAILRSIPVLRGFRLETELAAE